LSPPPALAANRHIRPHPPANSVSCSTGCSAADAVQARPIEFGQSIDPIVARGGGLSMWGVGSRSPAAWSAREIELQALATLAALAQIATPSAAHFLKSHQLLVQSLRRIEIGKKTAFPFRVPVICRLPCPMWRWWAGCTPCVGKLG